MGFGVSGGVGMGVDVDVGVLAATKFHYEYAGQHHYQERQNNAVQRTQQRICTHTHANIAHKDMRMLLYELLLLLLVLLLLLRWLWV